MVLCERCGQPAPRKERINWTDDGEHWEILTVCEECSLEMHRLINVSDEQYESQIKEEKNENV